MVETERKESDLTLIIAPGYEVDLLQKFIKKSCLSEIFGAKGLDDVTDAQQYTKMLSDECLALLETEELNLDEICDIFVAASMLYHTQAKPNNQSRRLYTLRKAFSYVDTLSPMHIHVATERLWCNLKQDLSSVFNILNICQIITAAGETGRAIALNLMWTILQDLAGAEIEMYRYRQFRELRKLLDSILQQECSLQVQYILLQATRFIVNAVVCCDNVDLIRAGYRRYLSYSRNELEKLKQVAKHWATSLIESPTKASNVCDLKELINNDISTGIVEILKDKIADMSNKENSA